MVGFCWGAVLQCRHRRAAGCLLLRSGDPGLAIFEGSKHQYPLYDALAMGVQMMVFTYLLGRTDSQGRNVIETRAQRVTKTRAMLQRSPSSGDRACQSALRRGVRPSPGYQARRL